MRRMVCIEDYLIRDACGTTMRLVRGKLYAVAHRQRKGLRTVFTQPMVMAPDYLFRKAKQGVAGGNYSKTTNAYRHRRAYWGKRA